MTRFVSVCGLLAAALAGAAPAHAEGSLPNGATANFERLYVWEDDAFREPSNPDVTRRYLNLAHCECARAQLGEEQTFQYDLRLSNDSGTSRPADIFVGAQCDNDMLRGTNCLLVDTVADIDQLVPTPKRLEVNIYEAINATNTGECRIEQGTATLWFMVDTDGAAPYEYTQTQAVGQINGTQGEVSAFDTRAPAAPVNLGASSAENGVKLTWDLPTANPEDVFAYQALCARADGQPVGKTFTARYQTALTLCAGATAVALEPSVIDEEAPQLTLPDAMAQLDEAFICGETIEPTATELLIDGLENGVPYTVALVVMDRYGNPSGAYVTSAVTPQLVTDFWEDLHGRGSKVEGGFCLSSVAHGTGTGTGGLGALLLVGAAAVLATRRPRARRRGRGAALLAGGLALAAGAPAARAQGVTPYWEEEAGSAELGADHVTWHAGIRLGPFVPAIDEQFGESYGPYGEMFGGYKILPMLDVDRIVWRGFGQLGFGGSIGYMSNTAKAWVDGSAPNDPDRMRSDGDENTFSLLPIAATAVYRFTYLDDRFGIPVVPYVRGGLSYYIWWIRTNGQTAQWCWDGTQTPGCDADKATGATIGFQGSIGLAVRAERIDAAAAASMRAGGIQHAGFYAELSMAKVDGFGSETKLAVGDTTWFAGVNFEF